MYNNHIFILPEELIIVILSFIETYDVMQFFIAYPTLTKILYDSKLIRSFNFNQEFRLDEQSLEDVTKLDLANVTTLSINNVYWLQVESLKKFIGKCKNLTHLSVMDTEMRGDKNNCLFLKENCTKLQSLGITVSHYQFCEGTVANLPSLKIAYFHIKIDYMAMSNLRMPSAYKKFESVLAYADYGYYPEFTTRFEPARENYVFRPIVFKEDKCKWEKLLENHLAYECGRHTYIPFGLLDVKYLQLNYYNFENIKIQEFSILDCTHPRIDCSLPSHKLQYDLLTSPKASLLKKLAIRYCTIFDHAINCPSHSKGAECQCSTFQKIVKNCNALEEVEIWECRKYNQYASTENQILLDIANNPELDSKIIDELHCIAQLDNLKKLFLINIPLNIAKHNFLEKIVKSCKKLECLTVTNSYWLENLLGNTLFLSLHYAKQLKYLRCDDEVLCVDSLLQTLISTNLTKLERVFVRSCAKSINCDILETFLKKYPQLIFFGIYNPVLPKKQGDKIQSIMDKYRTNNQKVFLFTDFTVGGSILAITNEMVPSLYMEYFGLFCKSQMSKYNLFKNTFSIEEVPRYWKI